MDDIVSPTKTQALVTPASVRLVSSRLLTRERITAIALAMGEETGGLGAPPLTATTWIAKGSFVRFQVRESKGGNQIIIITTDLSICRA